jgi:hypothetical protein
VYLEDKQAPYFYEHIMFAEESKLKRVQATRLYKVVTIVHTEHPHKNTYFIRGARLEEFLDGYCETTEHVVSVELVESMPSTEEKFSQKRRGGIKSDVQLTVSL